MRITALLVLLVMLTAVSNAYACSAHKDNTGSTAEEVSE
jgi:hypothetical protein